MLHPFLSKFFESTGVKESDAPGLSEECVPRAAALLHFLATGERDIHEFDLPFVKVLLGLEPVTPLCVEPGLIQASDEAASSHLLETVIGYWSVLRQTSVPGFRTAFLRRQGLLLADEAGWRLRVERRGHDLLLDYLPWGIGMVKLSWLQKAISTEW